MTTSNPPIAAWAPSTALTKLASRHNNAPCVLTDGPAEFNDVALIRLSDYEALQAECDTLSREAETERAIQRAAEVLPTGFWIENQIEKESGSVALFSPDLSVDCEFQGSIAEQIYDAIDAAIDAALHKENNP